MRDKKLINTIIIFSLIAIFISSYLLYTHYSEKASFCNLSSQFSCDTINRSVYSEIFNIPVALISLFLFIFILITSFYMKKNKNFLKFNKKQLTDILTFLMIISILFAVYLLYIELFVLYSICILCFALDVIILILLIMLIMLRVEIKIKEYLKNINKFK